MRCSQSQGKKENVMETQKIRTFTNSRKGFLRVLGAWFVVATIGIIGFTAGRASVEADEGVTLVVRHKVADFSKWKPVFDAHEDVRKQFGWTSYQLLTEVGDSNHVTIVARIRSAAQAKDFGKSSSLKEAMQKGGVQGPPDVTLLKVVEDKRY
jgi:heme-degrading monooxygenase HmoA